MKSKLFSFFFFFLLTDLNFTFNFAQFFFWFSQNLIKFSVIIYHIWEENILVIKVLGCIKIVQKEQLMQKQLLFDMCFTLNSLSFCSISSALTSIFRSLSQLFLSFIWTQIIFLCFLFCWPLFFLFTVLFIGYLHTRT